jgi:hypothetical protein
MTRGDAVAGMRLSEPLPARTCRLSGAAAVKLELRDRLVAAAVLADVPFGLLDLVTTWYRGHMSDHGASSSGRRARVESGSGGPAHPLSNGAGRDAVSQATHSRLRFDAGAACTRRARAAE